MERSPVADEIDQRMKRLCISSKRLSKEASLNETYVRDLLEGRSRNPKQDQLGKLLGALERLERDLPADQQTDNGNDAALTEPRRSTSVREMDVYVGMGGGGLDVSDEDKGVWNLPTDWLRSEVRASLDGLRIVTLEGDSMAGTLEPGDKVLVDTNRQIPSPPGLFVIYDGYAVVAKRIEVIQGSKPTTIRIISDNGRYQSYDRALEEVNIIGRIMGRWQRLS